MPDEFGNEKRYYAAGRLNGKNPHGGDAVAEDDALRLLHKYQPDVEARVRRAFKQWNLILRDYLRSETGLRLTVGDDASAVPVKVMGGLPRPISDLFKAVPLENWELLLHLSEIKSTQKGLEFVEGRHSAIVGQFAFTEQDRASADEIGRVGRMLSKLSEHLEQIDVQKRLISINEDILGAYYFYVPEIHLYWMVIGLMAGVLSIPVEALTFVVAAHELAHAYSHMGKDIDGEQWDMRAFARADISIVEGLAQFYAETVCDKVSQRFPAAKEAFRSLLELQGSPYHAHESWIGSNEQKGEVVRFGMINARRLHVQDCQAFEESLRQIHAQVAMRLPL